MKCYILLICVVGLIFAEFNEVNAEKRGLHFFRLRRSQNCIEVQPEMLTLIAKHGICPLGGLENYGFQNEK
nr:neuropeptide [Hymenolepis microstoma]